jgi:hypothetical protein
LREQRDVARDLPHRAGRDTERTRERREAIPIRVPRELGHRERELRGHRARNLEAAITERGERAGGAAELQHARLREGVSHLCTCAIERGHPAGSLEPEGGRSGVLQPGAPRHHRRRVSLRERGGGFARVLE